MKKILAVCGSPRRGNTEFMLNTVLNEITAYEKELILLREKDINRCKGCLSCDKTKKCVIQDYMQEIYQKLADCDILILSSPNYYDNVSGLLKDFIDRTNPFYETGKLKGKKTIALIVGGGSKEKSKRAMKSMLYFVKAHSMDLIGSMCFKALHSDELQKDEKSIKLLKQLGQKINDM